MTQQSAENAEHAAEASPELIAQAESLQQMVGQYEIDAAGLGPATDSWRAGGTFENRTPARALSLR